MSIQKKSLISALKTTQKANVAAAAPVAEAGKSNTSMRAGNNFSMKKNAISLKKNAISLKKNAISLKKNAVSLKKGAVSLKSVAQ